LAVTSGYFNPGTRLSPDRAGVAAEHTEHHPTFRVRRLFIRSISEDSQDGTCPPVVTKAESFTPPHL